jgi:DNA-binding transcriptional LysR family regulator
VDLIAVRTFIAVADSGQFQAAADDLAVSQQAVSKRVAALEKELGVRLFTRTPRGAELTVDGRAFLSHARDLLSAEERALAAVRPGRRPLRVDVLSRRVAPAVLLRDFHRAHPETELSVVTLFDADSAMAAVSSGAVDATFRAVPAGRLPDGVLSLRVLDEAHQLLTGPGHKLADADSVTPAQLVGHRIWIPGIAPGTEWGAYYAELSAAFGLTIDAVGPNFGTDSLLDVLAESPDVATLTGEQTHMLWPDEYDLRRIPVRDPVLAYPHCLIWRADNAHPALRAFRDFCAASAAPRHPDDGTWLPARFGAGAPEHPRQSSFGRSPGRDATGR